MATSNPTILLIHGCFSTPSCFDQVVPLLEKAGYSTLRATYPSSNPANPDRVAAEIDIQYMRDEVLRPLIERNTKNVILVLHSFGGVVGAGAAVGLSRTDRKARNLKGGVVGLIYVAGNIVKESQTLIESAGGRWPPWLIKDKPHKGLAIVEPMMDTLYNDCDTSLERKLAKNVVPQGYLCLTTPSTTPCWTEPGYQGKLAYIRTTLDRVNPLFAQDLWIESSGVHWDVVTMETSHAPYISQPQELSEHIVLFALRYASINRDR